MKNVYLLTIPSELKSAQNLNFNVVNSENIDFEDYNSQNNIIIRWGVGFGYVLDENGKDTADFPNVINPIHSIILNVNKPKALDALSQVVNTPTIYKNNVPSDVLAVYRPEKHTGGNGFNVKKGPFCISDGYYATEYINTNLEYRVWFCGQHTMMARRAKMLINNKEKHKYPCRSKWGYEFVNMSRLLRKDTLLAAKTIGLDVGAADVLYSTDSKKYYFLELNSAPSCDHWRVINFYNTNIPKLLKNINKT